MHHMYAQCHLAVLALVELKTNTTEFALKEPRAPDLQPYQFFVPVVFHITKVHKVTVRHL